jgi:hypothetical protein
LTTHALANFPATNRGLVLGLEKCLGVGTHRILRGVIKVLQRQLLAILVVRLIPALPGRWLPAGSERFSRWPDKVVARPGQERRGHNLPSKALGAKDEGNAIILIVG